MPLPTSRLNRRSSAKQVESAISACIAQLSEEKKGDKDWPEDRIAAACYADARRYAGSQKVPRK